MPNTKIKEIKKSTATLPPAPWPSVMMKTTISGAALSVPRLGEDRVAEIERVRRITGLKDLDGGRWGGEVNLEDSEVKQVISKLRDVGIEVIEQPVNKLMAILRRAHAEVQRIVEGADSNEQDDAFLCQSVFEQLYTEIVNIGCMRNAIMHDTPSSEGALNHEAKLTVWLSLTH